MVPETTVLEKAKGLAGLAARRRGSPAQGRALETLGHAVEYLIDSRLGAGFDGNQKNQRDAIGILMGASRAVFAECPEVLSVRQRLRLWIEAAE